ncbi:hypothetical protein BKA65DRAFT_5310 [Rhexocercosporidium sp. MPI-PUGE-AT-0058]|nr:hypothetical protein BKA65DRAFT_5310 [Rhexocercosporidium sp. MPI-PUGE-AT-0058]
MLDTNYDVPFLAAKFTSAVLLEVNCTSNGNKKMHLDCLRALPSRKSVNLAAQVNVQTQGGTNLTADRTKLDAAAPIVKFPNPKGTLHDDRALFAPHPTSDDLQTNLANRGFAAQADAVMSSGKSPLPSDLNTLLNIFKVTSRVSTAVTFSRLSAATIYFSVHNRLFKHPNVYL